MAPMYRNPVPTVDIIIEIEDDHGNLLDKKIVLILRKNPPLGWALPGGFVDYGESLEEAALREAYEETSLNVEIIRQFHTYSDPSRDPRQHTITTVYLTKARGNPIGRDDAKKAGIFSLNDLPLDMAFDHALIIDDYRNLRF